MDITTLAAFALTSFLIELTPGPNMAYLAVLSIQRGALAGMAAVAGVALGLALLGALAALGVGELLSANRALYEGLRWAGIAYLLYLAWDSYRDARKPLARHVDGQPAIAHFRRGLITNLLNPKAILFYLTVMPGFIDPALPPLGQTLLLGLTYVSVATLVHLVVVLAAGLAQPFLVGQASRARLGTVVALLLVAVAVWVGVSTAR